MIAWMPKRLGCNGCYVSVGRNKRSALRRKRSLLHAASAAYCAASLQAQSPRWPCRHVARLSPEKAQCAALIVPYEALPRSTDDFVGPRPNPRIPNLIRLAATNARKSRAVQLQGCVRYITLFAPKIMIACRNSSAATVGWAFMKARHEQKHTQGGVCGRCSVS